MTLRQIPVHKKHPDIVSALIPATLTALQVNPDAGLTRAEADARRKEHGCNEVAERKGHPVLRFVKKFWGVSAWMLELIMVLSAFLREYSDLLVVGGLLFINAVLAFFQERRAAGVVESLRQRLHVSARASSEANQYPIDLAFPAAAAEVSGRTAFAKDEGRDGLSRQRTP